VEPRAEGSRRAEHLWSVETGAVGGNKVLKDDSTPPVTLIIHQRVQCIKLLRRNSFKEMVISAVNFTLFSHRQFRHILNRCRGKMLSRFFN
jgi:hypothetical protein